jgi:5-(carboxyamino)imidazole ribonucleotide mutase
MSDSQIIYYSLRNAQCYKHSYMPPSLQSQSPQVGIIMGSRSDWDTMRHASEILTELGVPHECSIVSAHRTPDWMIDYATNAEARGFQVIIAGAGGAAHLPGMTAAHTILPVLGVPVQSRALKGFDSLLSIVQMPKGIPVGTHTIGEDGAINAALQAAAILALSDQEVRQRLKAYHEHTVRQTPEELT